MPLPSSSASGRNARRPCDEANAAQVSATKERGDCGVEVVESVDYLGAVKLELSLSPRAEALEALDHESSPALGHIDELQRFEARPNKLVLVVRQRRYMVAEDVIGETSTFRCAERTPNEVILHVHSRPWLQGFEATPIESRPVRNVEKREPAYERIVSAPRDAGEYVAADMLDAIAESAATGEAGCNLV